MYTGGSTISLQSKFNTNQNTSNSPTREHKKSMSIQDLDIEKPAKIGNSQD